MNLSLSRCALLLQRVFVQRSFTTPLTRFQRLPTVTNQPKLCFDSGFSSVRYFSSSSSVEVSKNLRVRLTNDVVRLEKDVGELLEDELASFQDAGFQEQYEALKKEVAELGFRFDETETVATLQRELNGRSIVVVWDPNFMEEEQEPREDLNEPANEQQEQEQEQEQEEAKEADGEEADGEEAYGEPEDPPAEGMQLPVKVSISSGPKNLIVQGEVSSDGLLYIYKLSCSEDESKVVAAGDLSEKLQHRLYDYLDQLGVGEQVSRFVRVHNEHRALKAGLQNLSTVADFFKNEKTPHNKKPQE